MSFEGASVVIHVTSELTPLREALCSQPLGFELVEPINTTQEHFLNTDPPTKAELLEEHRQLLDVVSSAGVRVRDLKCVAGCAYQVFARDVGFVVDSTLYLARMAKTVRQPEVESLIELSMSDGWEVRALASGTIEGGDVLLTEAAVFVAIGPRTTEPAVRALSEIGVGGRAIIQVAITDHVLHLDTVLAVLGNETVVYYPEGLSAGLPREVSDYYRIELTRAEMLSLAANVLPLSATLVVGQERHRRVNDVLRQRGIEVVTVEIPQLTKLGGGPRCCFLPVVRS
jgi:N-dimethylarginine dimethylaminohydrolase